ncbi:MAG: phasin family protein [Actinomycetota bacterium]
MAQNDVLKRYVDAGLAFTALTQSRAEALVKDLVKAGEVQADQARDAVADLLERSRKNTEKLVETVRREVRSQISSLDLASKVDLDKLEARIVGLFGGAQKSASKPAGAPGAGPKPAPAKKSPAKKSPAKKTAGAKAATKAGTKRAAAKRPAKSSRPEKRA